jgi:hypothetical protein
VSARSSYLFVILIDRGILRGYLPTALILAVLPTTQATQETVHVGLFSQSDLSTWEAERFMGETDYGLVEFGGHKVLKAASNGSASGLIKPVQIDLTRTPILVWSWRVDHIVQGKDERSKSGDDYPARVYVIDSGGLYFWRTRSLNYVWSSYQPVSSAWPNPYTANVVMVVAASGTDCLGQRVREVRDVRRDFRRYFGVHITAVDGVAVITDTDNTAGHAGAYYGDIYFRGSSGATYERGCTETE